MSSLEFPDEFKNDALTHVEQTQSLSRKGIIGWLLKKGVVDDEYSVTLLMYWVIGICTVLTLCVIYFGFIREGQSIPDGYKVERNEQGLPVLMPLNSQ